MALRSIEEYAIRGLSHIARRFGRGPTIPRHLEVGLQGEEQALFYLRRQGYTVVARRWTSAKVRGDLDLIAWHRATLCFVEVKSRTARDTVTAETAIDQGKRHQLRQLARVYLGGFPEPAQARIASRFDALSVYLLESGPEFELLEHAFGWSERTTKNWR